MGPYNQPWTKGLTGRFCCRCSCVCSNKSRKWQSGLMKDSTPQRRLAQGESMDNLVISRRTDLASHWIQVRWRVWLVRNVIILVMLQTCGDLGCTKPCRYWDKLPTSTCGLAGFLPLVQYHENLRGRFDSGIIKRQWWVAFARVGPHGFPWNEIYNPPTTIKN